MKTLKIKTSWLKRMESLSDAECGRLFRGMLQYASSGEVPSLSGSERIVWATAMDEIDDQLSISEKRAEAGRIGGSKPKQTEANESKPKQTEANESKPKQTEAKASKEKTPPIPPTPPITPVKENTKKTPPKGGAKESTLSFELRQAVDEFKAMRSRMRKPMTELAVKLLLERLDKLAQGDEKKMVAMLMQSIENGWTGVYELKQDRPVDRSKKRDAFMNYKEDGVSHVNLDDIALKMEDFD